MICIGVNLESFDQMYALIEPHDEIFCSAGVHPEYGQAENPSVEKLCILATRPKVVAIGETGLDYLEHSASIELQRERFAIHIEAARQCKLPLIIHSRAARQDTLAMLREHEAQTVGGVLHCFTEDWEMAEQAIALGFYISISGIVTFHKAQSVRDMAIKIPSDRLLIETDSPWLSPSPFRGKTNHPGRVALIAEKLAEIRGESLLQLAQTTAQNAQRLFRLNAPI